MKEDEEKNDEEKKNESLSRSRYVMECYYIVGPSFVTEIILEEGRCTVCAPFVRTHLYMRTKGEVKEWCKKYGYEMVMERRQGNMADVRNMEDFLEEKRVDETLELIEKNKGPISFVSLTCVYYRGRMAFVEEKIDRDWRREKPDLCQRVCGITNFGWLFVDEFEAAEERREELNYVEKEFEGKKYGCVKGENGFFIMELEVREEKTGDVPDLAKVRDRKQKKQEAILRAEIKMGLKPKQD